MGRSGANGDGRQAYKDRPKEEKERHIGFIGALMCQYWKAIIIIIIAIVE